MTQTAAVTTRCRITALLALVLAVVLSGCSLSTGSTAGGSTPQPAGPISATAVRVELRFGDHTATATLAGTPEAGQFAAMLPASVDLTDVWAQAKSGRLPHPITLDGSTPIHDPVTGGIYFWPTTEVIAIYYADLGQSVPDPGLIRLGTLDAGLDDFADAGRHLTIRIEPAAAPGT